MSRVTLSVHNSTKDKIIYTTVCEVGYDEKENEYFVMRGNKEIASHTTKTQALLAACDNVLQGFNEPGLYTALIDDAPYSNREVVNKKTMEEMRML